MFKNDERKNAVKKFEKVRDEYENNVKNIVKKVEKLYLVKSESQKILQNAYSLFEKISNRPQKLIEEGEEIKSYYELFEKETIEIERMNMKAPNGRNVVGGIAAGATIAALGPTALMGIATTFGTASTGVAISSLYGAAATNAALAWIGGGTLATGGGGMALGTTFLRMTGPVGWGIAAVVGVAGTIWTRKKNTEVIEKAKENIKQINKANTVVLERTNSVEGLHNNINNLKDTAENDLNNLVNRGLIKSYNNYTEEEKLFLLEAHNICKALGSAINEKINEETNKVANEETISSQKNVEYDYLISANDIAKKAYSQKYAEYDHIISADEIAKKNYLKDKLKK